MFKSPHVLKIKWSARVKEMQFFMPLPKALHCFGHMNPYGSSLRWSTVQKRCKMWPREDFPFHDLHIHPRIHFSGIISQWVWVINKVRRGHLERSRSEVWRKKNECGKRRSNNNTKHIPFYSCNQERSDYYWCATIFIGVQNWRLTLVEHNIEEHWITKTAYRSSSSWWFPLYIFFYLCLLLLFIFSTKAILLGFVYVYGLNAHKRDHTAHGSNANKLYIAKNVRNIHTIIYF